LGTIKAMRYSKNVFLEAMKAKRTTRGALTPAAVPEVHYDRPRAFVVSDDPKAGPASLYAVKVLQEIYSHSAVELLQSRSEKEAQKSIPKS
jgi:hypothetical protein